MPDWVDNVLRKLALLLAVLGATSLAFGSAADREAPAAVLPGLNADLHIEGPFTDALGKPLVAAWAYERTQSIDPMVFVDDDRTAHLTIDRIDRGVA